MVGIRSPITIHPLQAMVTEPMKPWLDPIIVSGSLHVYVSQSARGELVMGASLDPYELHSTRSTLDFAEGLATHMLDLFPFLSERQGQPPMGGHGGYDARLRADHGQDAVRAVSTSTPAGAPGVSRPRRCAARP
mgnify:CR=1 FL=1